MNVSLQKTHNIENKSTFSFMQSLKMHLKVTLSDSCFCSASRGLFNQCLFKPSELIVSNELCFLLNWAEFLQQPSEITYFWRVFGLLWLLNMLKIVYLSPSMWLKNSLQIIMFMSVCRNEHVCIKSVLWCMMINRNVDE